MEPHVDFLLVIFASLIAGMIGGCLVSVRFFWRWLEEFERAFQRDEAVFARVVRQFYYDDPILAHSVWKKVHPGIAPPWHQDPGGKET